MHGRPASRQPSPNRAIVVIVGRGGESSPNPPLTQNKALAAGEIWDIAAGSGRGMEGGGEGE